MAEQDKGKTKTVILRELESIKGLLDDDEIPLLQEVIDSAEEEVDSEETLDGDDLAELQQAYRDLLQARGLDPELSVEDGEPPILHEIETEPADSRPPQGNQAPASESTAKEPWEEVQTSLFETDIEPKEPASETTRRNSVTKASGENPFLPAHIRERLHGNRPPPLFEPVPAAGTRTRAPEITGSVARIPDRIQLIEEVVNSLLPQVRSKLRDALLDMDAEQLRQLLNDESARHKPK